MFEIKSLRTLFINLKYLRYESNVDSGGKLYLGLLCEIKVNKMLINISYI